MNNAAYDVVIRIEMDPAEYFNTVHYYYEKYCIVEREENWT